MKKKAKTKLKIDDVVVVVAGKDKGKRGKLLSFLGNTEKVLVEGVNVVKKTIKKTQENQRGGFQDMETPIHISNVMYYDSAKKKGVRIGYKVNADGKKERVFKG